MKFWASCLYRHGELCEMFNKKHDIQNLDGEKALRCIHPSKLDSSWGSVSRQSEKARKRDKPVIDTVFNVDPENLLKEPGEA